MVAAHVHGLVDTNAAFPAGFAGNMQDNKFVMIQCTDLEERSRLGLACFQAYKQAAEQPTRTTDPKAALTWPSRLWLKHQCLQCEALAP